MTMKPGRDTGSLTNHIMSRYESPMPAVGMGATLLGWTDRHAATVIDVKQTPKRLVVVVQRDQQRRTDENGMSDQQTYEYTRDPEGSTYTFRLTPKGWSQVGQRRGYGLTLGIRRAYHDYSF